MRRRTIFVFLNVTQIECVHKDGSVVFQNGKTISVDVIMHCTGYLFSLSFSVLSFSVFFFRVFLFDKTPNFL